MGDTETTSRTAFAERLLKFRRDRNISIPDMAAHLGITPKVIELYESAAIWPDVPTLIELAVVFDNDLHSLLTGKPSPAIEIEVKTLQGLKAQLRTLRTELKQRLTNIKRIDKDLGVIDKAVDATLKSFSKQKTIIKDEKSDSCTKHEKSPAASASAQG